MKNLFLALAGTALFSCTAIAGPVTLAKDPGPVNARCDGLLDTIDAWRACVGAADVAMPKAELFYAGYWLARSGQYREALAYLTIADKSDPRVETYIGFAIRKLGDVEAAFAHYNRALELDPNYAVARAYMGEAFLAQDNMDGATAQLHEIESRCGTGCPEFVDLKSHIDAYARGRG